MVKKVMLWRDIEGVFLGDAIEIGQLQGNDRGYATGFLSGLVLNRTRRQRLLCSDARWSTTPSSATDRLWFLIATSIGTFYARC